MKKPKFYTCYSNYFATGEGQTVMIAISTTKGSAERLFNRKFDEFFFKGADTVAGFPENSENLIPNYIREVFESGKVPNFEYYQCHHYNLS